MRKGILTTLMFAACVGWTPGELAAQQPDFTFNVPVELDRIHPNISFGRIRCAVYDEGGNHLQVRGLSRVPFDETGSYNGTITVTLDTDAGDPDPVTATEYKCTLELKLEDGGAPRTPDPGFYTQPAFRPKEGTPFNPRVEGPI